VNVGIIAGQGWPPAGGGGGNAWNPADVSPSGGTVFSFTESNRTATHVSGASTGAIVRGVTGHSSGGPWYFEVEILTAHTDGNGMNVGVAKDSATLLDNPASMGANDILLANGSGIISNADGSVYGAGVSFNGTGQYLRVVFEPGVGIRVLGGAGTLASFTPLLAFTEAGNFLPALCLGYHTAFGLYGQDGSVRLSTVAADFFFGAPAGTTEWG
jgi:hypothetical protein